MASLPAYLLPGVIISQPLHLEGDPSLATEILPGPPSISLAQQPPHRREQRKPLGSFSYLPASDPGSTYTGFMAGTTSAQDADGPRRKRIRMEKVRATGRPQRASTRQLNGNAHLLDFTSGTDAEPSLLPDADSEPFPVLMDSDGRSISRSNSGTHLQDPHVVVANGRARGTKRDKGKGKEIDPAFVRVKEEPKTISLYSPEPNTFLLNNEDHCSACRSQGSLVYCDGCPRAFHFWCLDPPVEAMDFPEGGWFCPSCAFEKNPPRKPPPSLFSPLIHQIQTSIPVEFQLPDDIRTFFKDVVTGPKGTYVDGADIRPPRLNRHGLVEDRDSYRFKDRNGNPVLCFRCGKSALPSGLAIAHQTRNDLSNGASHPWKSIISCDHCNLHWHLDCLDPPLPNMPSVGRKWMCPNHPEQLLHPKRRIPKSNPPLIEVTKPSQYNNGNIDIIPSEMVSTSQDNVNIDEILINGRRYRVPERVVILDFWGKVTKTHHPDLREPDVIASGASSPLTSLSSFGDTVEVVPFSVKTAAPEPEIVAVAQSLCNLRSILLRHGSPKPASNLSNKNMVHRAVQTDIHTEAIVSQQEQQPTPEIVETVSAKLPESSRRTGDKGSTAPSSGRIVSASRRKKSQPNLSGVTKRELRPRNKASVSQTPFDHSEDVPHEIAAIGESASNPTPPLPQAPKVDLSSAPAIKIESHIHHSIACEDESQHHSTAISVSTSRRKVVAKPQRRRRSLKKHRTLQDQELVFVNLGHPSPESPVLPLRPESSHGISHDNDSQLVGAPIKVSVSKRKIIALPQQRKPTPMQPEEKPTPIKGKKRKEMDESDREEIKKRAESDNVDPEKRKKGDGKAHDLKAKTKRHRPVSSLSSSDPATSNLATKISTPQATPILKIRLPRLSSLHTPGNAATLNPPKLIIENAKRS